MADLSQDRVVSNNQKLYNNLLKSGKVTKDEIGDFDTFNNLLSDSANASKLRDNLISKKNFSEEELGSNDDFLQNLDPPQIKPDPHRNPTGTPPITEQEQPLTYMQKELRNKFPENYQEETLQPVQQQVKPLGKVDQLKVDYLKKTRGEEFANQEQAKMQAPEQTEQTGFAGKLAGTVGSSFMTGMNKLNSWVADAPGFIYDLAGAPFRAAGLNVPTSQDFKDTPLQNISSYYKDNAKAYEKKVQEINPSRGNGVIASFQNGDIEGGILNLAGGIAESAPASIAMMLSGGATAPTIISGAAVFGAGKAQEMDENSPEMDYDKRRIISALNGTIEGIFETYLGSGAVGKSLAGIIKNQGKEAAQEQAKRSLSTVFADMITKNPWMAPLGEGFEEIGTQISQNLVDKYSGYRPELDLMEGVGDSFLSGVGMGGIHGAVIGLAKSAMDTRNATPITFATIEGQQFTVNNPEDLGVEGKPIFAKDAEGNVIPISGKKKDLITDVVTQTQGEIDQANQVAADQQALMNGISDPNAQVINEVNEDGIRLVKFSNGQSKIITPEGEAIANDQNEEDRILESVINGQPLPQPKVNEAGKVIEPAPERKVITQKIGTTDIDIIEGEEFDEVIPTEKVPLEKAYAALEKKFKDNKKFKVIAEKVQVEEPGETKYDDPIKKTVIKSIKIVPVEVLERQKAEADLKAKEQKQADTDILLDVLDQFNATPESRENKQQASEIEAIAKRLGYQTDRNAMNQIRLFDNSGTISKQNVTKNENISKAEDEKVYETEIQTNELLPVINTESEISLQNNKLQNEESEKSSPIIDGKPVMLQGENTTQAQQGEGNQEGLEENVINQAIEKYDNDENYTFDDLVNDIEPIVENENLISAIQEYRKDQEYDRSVSGRGDMQSAEEKLESVIRNYETIQPKVEVKQSPSIKQSYDFSKTSKDELLDRNANATDKDERYAIWLELKKRGPSFEPISTDQPATISLTADPVADQIAEQEINLNPTEAQKEAGNYKKGHVTVQGMDITIENPKGSVRKGTDEDGKAWENVIQSHYGYFKRTVGKDNDHIDTFIGSNPESNWIFVVDQNRPKTGEFDESKVMTGFNGIDEAKAAYLANYQPDWKGFRSITAVPVDQFKEWLNDGAKQKKPFSEYKGHEELLKDVAESAPDINVATKKTTNKSNSITGKAKEVEVSESDIEGLALQYFINGGMVKSDEILRMFKDSSSERGFRMSYTSNENGQTVNQIAHNIWEALPENIQNGLSEMEVYNSVEKVIMEHISPISMAKAQLKRYSADPNQGYSEEWLNNQLKIEEEERLAEIEIWTNDLAQLEIIDQLPTENELIELFLPENTDNGKQEIDQRGSIGEDRPIDSNGNDQIGKVIQGGEPGVQGEVESEKVNKSKPLNEFLSDSKKEVQEKKPKGITTVYEEDNGETLIYGTKTNQVRLSVKGYSLEQIQDELNFEKYKSTNSEKEIPVLESFLENHIIDDAYKAASENLKDQRKLLESTKITIPWLEKKLVKKQSTPLPEEKQSDKKPLDEVLKEGKETVEKKKGDNNVMFRIATSEETFYSPTEKALNNIQQNKGSVEQFKAMLLKNGAKQAEMDWMGFDDLFHDGKQSVTKSDIQNWIDQNKIEVKEVTKQENTNPVVSVITKTGIRKFVGDRAGAEEYIKNSGRDDLETITESMINEKDKPKFSQYTEPGGQNYKELLLTMPEKAEYVNFHRNGYLETIGMTEDEYVNLPAEERIKIHTDFVKWQNKHLEDMKSNDAKRFKSSHYDEPNILAHVRFNERTGENGERVLFVEEFQSDWQQSAKKQGMSLTAKEKAELEQISYPNEKRPYGQLSDAEKARFDELSRRKTSSIPQTPFSKTDQWVNLAFRRMMKYAAENGFDRIAWTNGEMQAARYDLSKQVSGIYSVKKPSGRYSVVVKDLGFSVIDNLSKEYEADELEPMFGKDVAEKIINNSDNKTNLNPYKIEGENLAVGGSGMKAFYDAIIPSAANKLGKAFGARVEETQINTNDFSKNEPYVIAKDEYGLWYIHMPNDTESVFNEGLKTKKEAILWAEENIGKSNLTTVQSFPVTQSMIESVKGGVPLFRVSDEQNLNITDTASSDLSNRPNVVKALTKISDELGEPVHIINSSEIPAQVGELKKQITSGNRVPAFFYNGKIYLLSDQVTSVSDALKSYLHELIVHKGLREVFAGAEPTSIIGKQYGKFNDLMVDVFGSMSRSQKIAIASKYVPNLYNKNGKIMYTPTASEKALIGEEFLAHVSENQDIYDEPTLSRWQQFINRLWQIVRKAFRLTSNQFSQKDLTDIVRESRERLKSKTEVNEPNSDYLRTTEINKAYGSEQLYRDAIEKTVELVAEDGILRDTDGKQLSLWEYEKPDQSTSSGNKPISSIPKVVKRTVLKNFKESGYVDVIGQKINSPQDIADLWAIHRSPYIEKFHVVFLNFDDEIVGSSAITCGDLTQTFVITADKIQALADSYNAASYYLLHNHPSGNHKVSLADVASTLNTAINVNISCKGHVVMDHNKFSFIPIRNLSRYRKENLNDYDTITEYERSHVREMDWKNQVPRLFSEREKIMDENKMMQIGRVLLSENGYNGAVLFLSQSLEVNGYDVIPKNTSLAGVTSIIYNGIRNNVGSRFAIIHDGSKYDFNGKWVPAGIVDVINTKTNQQEFPVQGPRVTVNENDVQYLWEPESPYGSNTILINGVSRSTLNSNGKPIANSEEGIRNFWTKFNGSYIDENDIRDIGIIIPVEDDAKYDGPDMAWTEPFTGMGKAGKNGEWVIHVSSDKRSSFLNKLTAFTPEDFATYVFRDNSISNKELESVLKEKNISLNPDWKKHVYGFYMKPGREGEMYGGDEVRIELQLDDNLVYLGYVHDVFLGVNNVKRLYYLSSPAELPQIKSATGNNGSFSPESNDIRFRVDKAVEDLNKINSLPKSNLSDLLKSVNEIVEANMTEARGIQSKPFSTWFKEKIQEVKESAQHFKHITEAEFPIVYDKLRQFEAIPDRVKKEAYEKIAEIVRPILKTPEHLTAFERYIVLQDLIHDVEETELFTNKELPWGYESIDEIKQDMRNVRSYVMRTPAVLKAIRDRQAMMKEVKTQLVNNKLLADKDNDQYFHHQVLKHMDERASVAVSSKDVRNHKKGWQRSRQGSILAYNTNYVESEFEVIAQSLEQLAIKKILGEIGKKIDIMPELVKKANDEGGKWRDYIPEGYKPWYPVQGTHAYKAASLAERAVQNVINQEGTPDVSAQIAEVEGSMWVIPEKVAKQLDSMKDPEKEMVWPAALRMLTGKWKQWILLNPYSAIKYNFNNMSGDIDIVMAYDPTILKPKYAKTATTEAWNNLRGKGMSEDMKEALQYGIITSGLSIQEIPDVNQQTLFKSVTKGSGNIAQKLWGETGGKYWGSVTDLSQLRENVLRLASYKFFKEQIESGNKPLGASDRKAINALYKADTNSKEIAAKLARELMGDYGNLSQAGQWFRSHSYPFWSWVEINSPRYYRLLKNTKFEDNTGTVGRITGVVAAKTAVNVGKLGVKAMLLMGLVVLWNRAMFPDEDDELSKQKDRKLKLIIGRRDDGSIMTMKVQGAFSDVLSFFSLEDVVSDVKSDKTAGKMAKEGGNAFVNKFAQGAMPLTKTLAEVATKKSLYPDVLNPRPIRDRAEQGLRIFKMDKIYNYLTHKPSRPFGKEVSGLLVYDNSPGEAAYYTMRQNIFDFMKDNGEEFPSGEPTDRSNALYYYKQSLKFGDPEKAAFWFEKYKELGGTGKGYNASMKKGMIINTIPNDLKAAWIKSLDAEDKEILEMANKWYFETYLKVGIPKKGTE